MSIFTRFRDIVSSNINAILDRAEDPEKMVRLMIQEMEDTMIEVKSNCAGVIASQKQLERNRTRSSRDVEEWEAKAQLAVDKGRDELARSALVEKRRASERHRAIEEELEATRATVAHFQEDIALLEAKLADAREKQRTILQRRQAAESRFRTQSHVRRVDTADAFARFESFELGIDRMEAEADLVDGLRPKRQTLREQLNALEHEEEIEKELNRLKKGNGKSGADA